VPALVERPAVLAHICSIWVIVRPSKRSAVAAASMSMSRAGWSRWCPRRAACPSSDRRPRAQVIGNIASERSRYVHDLGQVHGEPYSARMHQWERSLGASHGSHESVPTGTGQGKFAARSLRILS
jgi:hypothetical protein